MRSRTLAVHRTIVVVDVEGFGDSRRTGPHQVAVRDVLYRAVERGFDLNGIAWTDCYHEDRGDGVLILSPVGAPKLPLVESLPESLAKVLRRHNAVCPAEQRIRLRVALHAGEVIFDEHGVAGPSVNLAFRLLDARPLKLALAGSRGVLALIASSSFFEKVVRHSQVAEPTTWRPVRVAVKETTTTGWICLPDDPYPRQEIVSPAEPVTRVPRQLPGAVPHFVGRAGELARLSEMLHHDSHAVVISAVDGTAGIGKTALAVQWAHQVADRFPDGQMYLNLRGYHPTGQAVSPAEAVRSFLDALGVAPERVPAGVDEQIGLYREITAQRRMLIVLDNANSAEHVRPLLPAGAGCVALITSRSRLASLVAAEGARPLTLDLLTEVEAHQLLVRRLGAGKVAAEPHAVAEIITLCARLPLALSIVAARAAARPGGPLTSLAAELREATSDLDAFGDADELADIRAVFSWSYDKLPAGAARLFRLMAMHPGPDITPDAAASLTGTALSGARGMLVELSHAHMVTEHTPGRFIFHDLLRAYALEQATAQEPASERDLSQLRMLDHYLYTAYTASRLIHPRVGPITLAPAADRTTPHELADYAAAWTWFQAEHSVLLAIIQRSFVTGRYTHTWQLAWTLLGFLERSGHWHDLGSTQHTALTAAERSDSSLGQAHANRGLGRAFRWLGRYDEAIACLERALEMFSQSADPAAQADVHNDLSGVLDYQGRPADALPHAQAAFALSDACGSRLGQARAMNWAGFLHAQLGNSDEALTCCRQALALYLDIGDRRGEAAVLDIFGFALHHAGDYDQAVESYQEALALRQNLGERYGQAETLIHLGDTYCAAGDRASARGAWDHALEILDELGGRLGHADAGNVRAKLRDLDDSDTTTRVQHAVVHDQ
jgi:tetratricopeptide (TPR) repeat protein